LNINNLQFNIPDPPKKKKKIGRKILLVAIIIWGIYHSFTSDSFETEPPRIEIEKFKYWNFKKPINLLITDNSAIKSYRIVIDNGDGKLFEYANISFDEPTTKRVEVNITMPRSKSRNSKYTTIFIYTTDFSNWSFFNGNSAKIKETFIIDKLRPAISIIASSYGIRRGGAATVIFKVDDKQEDTISDIYIESQTGRKFIPQPFYKDNQKYYISLVAWPITDISFRGNIIAKDKAGNISQSFLNLYLKEKKYKVSNMILKESFLSGKIASLASEHEKSSYTNLLSEYFKIVNEDIRDDNEKLLFEITSKVDKTKLINNFNIIPFKPLKGSTSVASFGDHRKYYYEDEFVSEAYHMGLDMASVKMAPIISSNKGEIVFNGDNGVFGTTPVVSHGLGLYSIYSHCSSTRVQVGDIIDKGHILANTGKTGLALGDHVHFGIYVQGIPVRPEEWMDRNWIKNNLTDIIANAKKLIERQ